MHILCASSNHAAAAHNLTTTVSYTSPESALKVYSAFSVLTHIVV